MMDWVRKNHLLKRGLFAYVSLTKALTEIYVPFVAPTNCKSSRKVYARGIQQIH